MRLGSNIYVYYHFPVNPPTLSETSAGPAEGGVSAEVGSHTWAVGDFDGPAAAARNKGHVISSPPPARHNGDAFLPAPRHSCRGAAPLSRGRRLIAAAVARARQNRRVICSAAGRRGGDKAGAWLDWFVNRAAAGRGGAGAGGRVVLQIRRVVIQFRRSALRPSRSCPPMKTSAPDWSRPSVTTAVNAEKRLSSALSPLVVPSLPFG